MVKKLSSADELKLEPSRADFSEENENHLYFIAPTYFTKGALGWFLLVCWTERFGGASFDEQGGGSQEDRAG